MNHYSLENETDYIQLIGGLSNPTPEEKIENIKQIETAIKNMKAGQITKLKIEVFAKTYPEGLEYFKKYYNLLFELKLKSIEGWHNNQYKTSEEARKEVNLELCLYRKKIAMIYLPLVLEGKMEFKQYINKMGMETKTVINILKFYQKILETPEYQEAQSIPPINPQLIPETILSKMNLFPTEVCKNNEITTQSSNDSLKVNSSHDEDKELQTTVENYYQYQLELVNIMGNYLIEGIIFEGKKINFTMLDYYSITAEEPKDLMSFLNRTRYKDRATAQKRSKVLDFLRKQDIGLKIYNAKEIAQQNISFIIQGNRVDITEEVAQSILDLFTENHIPFDNVIIYSALQRYARQHPIFPLLLNQNEKVEGNSNKTKPYSKVKIKPNTI